MKFFTSILILLACIAFTVLIIWLFFIGSDVSNFSDIPFTHLMVFSGIIFFTILIILINIIAPIQTRMHVNALMESNGATLQFDNHNAVQDFDIADFKENKDGQVNVAKVAIPAIITIGFIIILATSVSFSLSFNIENAYDFSLIGIAILVYLTAYLLHQRKISMSTLERTANHRNEIITAQTVSDFSWEDLKKNLSGRFIFFTYCMLFFGAIASIFVDQPDTGLLQINDFQIISLLALAFLPSMLAGITHRLEIGIFSTTRLFQLSLARFHQRPYFAISSTGITIGEWHDQEINWQNIKTIQLFRANPLSDKADNLSSQLGIILILRSGYQDLSPICQVDQDYLELLRKTGRQPAIISSLNIKKETNIIHNFIRNLIPNTDTRLLPYTGRIAYQMHKATHPYPLNIYDSKYNSDVPL